MGRFLFGLALATALAGCFLKTPGMDRPLKPQAAPNDTGFVKTETAYDDSMATFSAGFAHFDSLRSPDSAAAEMLQLALQNFLGLSPKDEKFYEVKVWLANHYFTQEKYDSALALYQEVLKSDAKGAARTEASQMVAQTYVRLGDADQAQDWFQAQLQDKDSATRSDARERLAQALYVQAERAEKDGKLEEAAKYYGDVTRAFPSSDISPVALYNCTVLRERLGQWSKALAGYNKFTEAYYNSPMLPRVLFRQAKTREKLNDWAGAADGYWKLASTYPSSEQGEPALYNAGFAYANARMNDKAAQAFETYVARYPQAAESPNLLFRAVEIRAEQQQWAQVSELHLQFQRRYGHDRNRAVQAQCLGGLAAYHQGRTEEARQYLQKAVEGFRTQGSRDAQSRIFAAQSQFTLGEMARQATGQLALREAQLDGDLEEKTRLLKTAVAAYLKVFDYRIAEWALRSAHALGALFEDYGRAVRQVPITRVKTPAKGMERSIQSLETMAAAWIEAADHYEQAATIAAKQGVHDRFAEEAALKPVQLRQGYAQLVDTLWQKVQRAWPIAGLPGEKAVAEAMEQLAYRAVLAAQAVQVGAGFDKTLETWNSDSLAAQEDSLAITRPTRTLALKLLYDLGRRYVELADTVRSAALPADSMEAFFFQAKLVREGLAPIDKEAVQAFDAGFQVAKDRRLLKSPWADSLRIGLGKALYIQARSLDKLARRALANPPIPSDAPPAMRKTYEPRFEEIGYQLQDAAMAGYKQLVQRAKAGQAETVYAELALVRLFEAEPDAWSQTRKTSADSAAPLLPHKPWDDQDLTPERLAFLKGLDITIPHLKP